MKNTEPVAFPLLLTIDGDIVSQEQSGEMLYERQVVHQQHGQYEQQDGHQQHGQYEHDKKVTPTPSSSSGQIAGSGLGMREDRKQNGSPDLIDLSSDYNSVASQIRHTAYQHSISLTATTISDSQHVREDVSDAEKQKIVEKSSLRLSEKERELEFKSNFNSESVPSSSCFDTTDTSTVTDTGTEAGTGTDTDSHIPGTIQAVLGVQTLHAPQQQQQSLQYRLSAVVRHIGVSAFSGHYICDTFCPMPSSQSSHPDLTASSGTALSVPSSSDASYLSNLGDDDISLLASIMGEQTPSSVCDNDVIDISTTATTTTATAAVSASVGGDGGVWKRNNDSLVTTITEQQVLSDMCSPYVFFYTRI